MTAGAVMGRTSSSHYSARFFYTAAGMIRQNLIRVNCSGGASN